MLKPSMQDLMKKVNNRYLLVNLSAQRARDLCSEEETTGKELPDKPVKLALDEISDGTIEYREGPKPEPESSRRILLLLLPLRRKLICLQRTAQTRL